MNPEDSNSPGLNTHPDFSSVPLPEPTPIKSPYAPMGGTLGDIADSVANDSGMTPQSQPMPIPTPGIASDNPESVNSSAAQPSSPVGKKPKAKIILLSISAVAVVVCVFLFLIIAKPFNENTPIGGSSSQSGPFYDDKAFIVSSEVSGKKRYAIYNSNGEAVTDFIYDGSRTTFIGGTVLMKKDGKYGLVGQDGKEVIEFGKYGKIVAYGGLYGLNRDGKDILVNNKGEMVTEYNVDDFSHYNDYTGGPETAYTLFRKDNHYVVFSPYGVKVTEFDSVITPTISSPDMGKNDGHTIVVYSGGVIVFDDKGNETRRLDKNITRKMFGIFASKSGNIIGLSTVNIKLIESLGLITTPNDQRDNALIMGAAYYEYNHKDCAGLYYNDSYTEGDEDGFVLCMRGADTRTITRDGSLSPSAYYYLTAKMKPTIMTLHDDIFPITNDSYATMTKEVTKVDNVKAFSIFYKGKKVTNIADTKELLKTDTKSFTKTSTRNTYNLLGMNDSYIIQHVNSKMIDKYADGSFSKLVENKGDATGELIYMSKKGEKICTFDKEGYTATTAKSSMLFPDQKKIYDVSSTDVTGFVNGVALVRKVDKNGSFDKNGYTRINDKCEVVNEDVYYESLKKVGSLAMLTSKKANRYTTELINEDGHTIASASANNSAPKITEYTNGFISLGTEKASIVGYGKVLKQIDHFCHFESTLATFEHYIEFTTAGPSNICDDKEAVGGEHFYYLPSGKEFYHWSERDNKTGGK